MDRQQCGMRDFACAALFWVANVALAVWIIRQVSQ